MLLILLMLPLGGGAAWWLSAHTRARGGFVGSRECRDCHEAFYQKWATSHHGLAMQPYTPTFAQAQLRPQTNAVVIGQRQYRYDQQAGAVQETGPQGACSYPVTVVMGGKNVYYLLTPLERGLLQVLPVSFDVQRQRWFDTAASAVRHFADRRDEALEWTDRLYTFNTACFACHVSQLATHYNVADDSYATTWLEPGINCETCHGPGAEHVRVCRAAPTNQPPRDLRIIIVRTMSPAPRNDLCATCHAKLSPLTSAFAPGDRFFDHFELTCLEDPDFYPDGRDLGENYTFTGWRLNRCARMAQLDCVHCHTSSGRNRFPGAAANQSCLPCHKERVAAPMAHTHHSPGTNSPTCISCHMPMTEFGRMRHSDHSFRPPMPTAAKQFGSPLACLLCHTKQKPEWAEARVRQWHTNDYQAATLRWAELVQAARRGDWSQNAAMLTYITDTNREEIVAVSLIRLLVNCPDAAKWPVFVHAGSDPSPLVRAAAAAGLEGRFDGDELAALLRAVRDEIRLVRIRAAQALAGYPVERLVPDDRAALARATAELEQSLTMRPDDAVSLYNLGNYHMTRGFLNTAVTNFESALRLRPDFVPPAVNISLALNQLGRNVEAEQHLRMALVHSPTNSAILQNLALLLGEQGHMEKAHQAWLNVLKVEPRQPTAAYNLAVITGATDPKAAVAWAAHAAEWAPHEWKYAATQVFYLRQTGDTSAALAALERFVTQNPTSDEGLQSLANARAEAGQTTEVEGTHRRVQPHAIENDTRIPEPARLNHATPVRNPITNNAVWMKERPITLPNALKPKVENVLIYQPKTEWTYSHHPSLTFFKGRFYAIWSNGRKDEDAPGQRVLMATSEDFVHWSKPRPLVDSQRDEQGGERVLTAAGFHQHEDLLVAYFGNYGPHKETTHLQAMTTTDGTTWSAIREIDVPVNPNHGPQRTASGRLIISGNISFPWSDDPAGLTGWHMTGIYPASMAATIKDDPISFREVAQKQGWNTALCEGSFFQTDDGVLHMLLRNAAHQNSHHLWLTESRNNGATWSEPVETNFSDTNAKFHFGRLPDGRFYYVGNPIGGGRTPLVLSLARDGVRFDQHFILGDTHFERHQGGAAKGGEYGYPHTLVHDGFLYTIVSRQKEAVEVLRVALSELNRLKP